MIIVNWLIDNNPTRVCTCFFLQSWDAYFRNNAYRAPPALVPAQPGHVPLSQFGGSFGGAVARTSQPDEKTIDDHLAVQAIIRSYQVSDSLAGMYGQAVSSAPDTATGCFVFDGCDAFECVLTTPTT